MKVKTYEEMFGKPLTIRDLVEGFDEDTKTGKVVAYDGRLNIRPPYQREFIYETEAQQKVIDTVMKGYPLNVMYWAKIDDDMYEVMDGQQRILSICKFYDIQQVIPLLDDGKIRKYTFDEFDDRQTKQFLDYPLTVYICDGKEEEKLAWFRVINIAGIKLTDQEMRNAIYSSPWVTNAKTYFSNIKGNGFCSEGHVYNGHTYGDYVDVVSGSNSESEKALVRQKLLEVVLEWATDKYNIDNGLKGKNAFTIDDYMHDCKLNKENALDLWRYYEDVMEWVKTTFPTYRKEMKGIEWGKLYNRYKDKTPENANERANDLFDNYGDEISNKKGVYEAVLAKDLKYIHSRSFDVKDKQWVYKKQNGVCPYCHKIFPFEAMQGDHIRPWSKGGLTVRENLQMLCADCNGKKSGYDTQYDPWDGKDYKPFDIKKWDETTE